MLDADLTLERVAGDERQRTVGVKTLDDGTLVLRSYGKLPKVSLSDLSAIKSFLRQITNASGQPIVVHHRGMKIFSTSLQNGETKVSFHIWTALLSLFKE